MKNIRFISSKLTFFVMLFWIAGTGQTARAEQSFTFVEAVQTALQNNHELRASRSVALAGNEAVGIARSHLGPRVTFEERYLRTVNPGYAFMTKLNQERIEQQDFNPATLNNPEAINDFQTSFSLEQPLFTRRGLIGLEMSRAESAAKTEDSLRKQEEVAYQVAQAATSILTMKSFLDAARKAVEEARELVRVTEVRHRSGLGQYSDTLRAATSLSESEQRQVSAEKNLDVAKRMLGLLLGMEDSADILGAIPDVPLRDLNDYTRTALTRPDVKSGEIREENARQNIKLAEAGYFPSVGVGGSYQLNDPNRPLGAEANNWQVAAFLKWDLFDGTRREYERAKAKHEAAGAQERLSALKKAVSFKVYEAYLSIGEARKNMELAQQALKTAEEGKRLVRVRYENGLYPLLDLLNAQTSLDQARAGSVAREGDYRLSVIRLSYESGTIMKDLHIEP